MAATPFEHADQASRVLRAIVAEHGPELLSRPRELGKLLADLLPDAPRIARLLVTAAQDQGRERIVRAHIGGNGRRDGIGNGRFVSCRRHNARA